jgi:hypothetical protein
MAGYAASATLHGGVPHFAGGAVSSLESWHDAQGVPAAMGSDDHPGVVTDHLELVGRPLDETIADWVASVGESWSQLTFFLFDPESWR